VWQCRCGVIEHDVCAGAGCEAGYTPCGVRNAWSDALSRWAAGTSRQSANRCTAADVFACVQRDIRLNNKCLAGGVSVSRGTTAGQFGTIAIWASWCDLGSSFGEWCRAYDYHICRAAGSDFAVLDIKCFSIAKRFSGTATAVHDDHLFGTDGADTAIFNVERAASISTNPICASSPANDHHLCRAVVSNVAVRHERSRTKVRGTFIFGGEQLLPIGSGCTEHRIRHRFASAQLFSRWTRCDTGGSAVGERADGRYFRELHNAIGRGRAFGNWTTGVTSTTKLVRSSCSRRCTAQHFTVIVAATDSTDLYVFADGSWHGAGLSKWKTNFDDNNSRCSSAIRVPNKQFV